jgi:hypothetical protein
MKFRKKFYQNPFSYIHLIQLSVDRNREFNKQ